MRYARAGGLNAGPHEDINELQGKRMKSNPSRTRRAALALLAILTFGAALPAHAGEVFKTRDFAVTLPDGWVQMSKDELKQFNANIRKHAPKKKALHFAYGFHPGKSAKHGTYPYMVARVSHSGRISPKSLRKLQTIDLGKALEKQKGNLPGFISRAMMGHLLYDPSLHTIWVTKQTKARGKTSVRGLTAIIATRKGFLQFSAWATDDSFAKWFPEFYKTMASVALPRAMRY